MSFPSGWEDAGMDGASPEDERLHPRRAGRRRRAGKRASTARGLRRFIVPFR
jgi:hypothetical protein